MDSLESLATFFGWCTVINAGIVLTVVLFMLPGAHEFVGLISAKLFGITKEEAKASFFQVFHQYRLAIFVLNVVPYFALKLMT